MTDREFRHLRRAELIEIIYKLQETEAALRAENTSLTERLNARDLKLSQAGSIAEAAMSLNNVFESAQAAADQYVVQVRQLQADTESRTVQMLSDAQAQQAEILSGAERQRDAMLAEAEEKRSAVLSDAAKKLAEAKKQHDALLSDGQSQHDALIAEAESRRDALLSEAQAKHDEMIAAAEQETAQKWQELNEKVQHTLETYAELRGVMESLQERH